jgi:hypothetical protein
MTMKILMSIKSGFFRSLKAWKGIIVFWVISFIMVSFLTVPLRASLKAAFGKSMVIEKLMDGINVDVIGDLGRNLHLVVSSLFSGIVLLSLAAILINVFITGGIFDSLRAGSGKFPSENFFRASAKNFWSFLVISSILYLILIILLLVIIIIPVSVAANGDSAPDGIVLRTLVISCSIFFLAMSLILLVADYARAWQASQAQKASFKALGFGFSQTFRTFLSSFPLILILLVFQALPALGVIKLIAGFTPVTGGGVFILFIISQLIIVLKIFLKVLRFGSITALMKQNLSSVPVITENPVQTDQEYYQDIQTELKGESDVR